METRVGLLQVILNYVLILFCWGQQSHKQNIENRAYCLKETRRIFIFTFSYVLW